MSVKSVVSLIVALALILGAGITEVIVLNKKYRTLSEQCETLIEKAADETLTTDDYQQFDDDWYQLRETSELLLPHLDVYEINLRVAECRSYVKNADYENAEAQLNIIAELLEYVPHLMIPNFKHIF